MRPSLLPGASRRYALDGFAGQAQPSRLGPAGVARITGGISESSGVSEEAADPRSQNLVSIEGAAQPLPGCSERAAVYAAATPKSRGSDSLAAQRNWAATVPALNPMVYPDVLLRTPKLRINPSTVLHQLFCIGCKALQDLLTPQACERAWD